MTFRLFLPDADGYTGSVSVTADRRADPDAPRVMVLSAIVRNLGQNDASAPDAYVRGRIVLEAADVKYLMLALEMLLPWVEAGP